MSDRTSIVPPIYCAPRLILGVDPGLHGAFVVYNAQEKAVVHTRIIPTLVVERNRKKRTLIDIPTLVNITRGLKAQHPEMVAFMELVGANPMHGRRQGTSSMFNFGNTNGAIETALVAAELAPMKVTPAVWKKALGCTQDKNQALARASQLIPESTAFWTPKRGVQTKEDCIGYAEAAMIALWGAQKLGLDTHQKELPIAA